MEILNIGTGDISSETLKFQELSAPSQATGKRFVDWVADEMNIANEQINASELQLRELAAGRTENLHQVMMSLSKAKTSFSLIVEARNKLMEGYQEVMRMQL